jgi:hypothetical protein
MTYKGDKDDNLRHWRELTPTDPKQTKPFQRPGGFRGTAIKPAWTIMRLTEHFGPMGIGWGTREPKYNIIDTGAGGEIMVFCVLEGWYKDDATGEVGTVWGIGGDKVASKRAGAMFANDEAYKSAYTDALSNAFMRIGTSADIYLGLFEDVKYLMQVREHYDNSRAIQTQITQEQFKEALPKEDK